jgi:DeoR family transcriptional regulator of aga operon
MRNAKNTVDRRKMILNLLTEEGKVFVNELSRRFSVSEVTIRNDLDQLEKKNLLIRARGGAMVSNNVVSFDQRISEKNKLNLKEKIRIGTKAAGLVREGDTIILDSGTTTSEVAKNLEGVRDLTVITNALNIANILINFPNLNLIIPGGMLRKTSLSLVGPIAERSLRGLYVDKLIMGVDGFDTRTGIYTPNVEEAHINNLMISIARQVILVTDSSKFNRKSLAFICSTDQINQVVTDSGIPAEDLKHLRDSGVEVIIAD